MFSCGWSGSRTRGQGTKWDDFCGRRDVVTSTAVHVLCPGTCEYTTFCGKSDEVKDLEMERLSWMQVGPGNHRSPSGRQAGPSASAERLEGSGWLALKVGRRPQAKECRQRLEIRRVKETDSALEPQERNTAH